MMSWTEEDTRNSEILTKHGEVSNKARVLTGMGNEVDCACAAAAQSIVPGLGEPHF